MLYLLMHYLFPVAVTQEKDPDVITSTSVAYNCIHRSADQVKIDSMLVQPATYDNVSNNCGLLPKARDYKEPIHSNTDNRNADVVRDCLSSHKLTKQYKYSIM